METYDDEAARRHADPMSIAMRKLAQSRREIPAEEWWWSWGNEMNRLARENAKKGKRNVSADNQE